MRCGFRPSCALWFTAFAAVFFCSVVAIPNARSAEAVDTPARRFATEGVAIQSRSGVVVLKRIEPRAQWGDLRVSSGVRSELRKIAATPRKSGAGVPVLFSGSNEAAKTGAAEVIANGLKLPLYRVDLSAVVSKEIGETEKNLDRVFDAAASGGAILLFDEADALFGKRTDVKDSHDRYANQEISYLLQRLETFDGLAILATNSSERIDPELLRRFRHVVDFPPAS